MNEWVVQTYMSGTHIVTRNMIDEPHYYVYADKRYQVCCELRDWLNGKIKEPDWLKSLQYHPNTKETCIGEDGIDIAATGPMILPPDDNGALNWQFDYSDEAKQKRLNLIEKLIRRNNGLDG